MSEITINEKLISFLLFLPFFFISLAVHEFFHAYSASKLGDNTAKKQGRLSLNPMKHLDLTGSLLMPLLSFASGYAIIGWAKPVPVNRNNFKNALKDDAIVSFAGPLSNFIFSILLFTVYVVLARTIDSQSAAFIRILTMFKTASYFNIFLCLFNLLPIPPLDGSHIIFDFFPGRLTAKLMNSGIYGLLILMIFINTPLWGYFLNIVKFIFEIFISIGGKF